MKQSNSTHEDGVCHRKTKFIEKIGIEYPRFQIEKLRTDRAFGFLKIEIKTITMEAENTCG